MFDDPIVAEVRAIRQQLAAECDDNLEQIMERARQRQLQSGRRVVSFENQNPVNLSGLTDVLTAPGKTSTSAPQ